MRINSLLAQKILFVFAFVIMSIFVTAKDAHAVIPDIHGRVVVAGTNAPVAGVWVAMSSSGCQKCPTCIKDPATRYEQTDSQGYFVFAQLHSYSALQPGGTCESSPKVGNMIDTNLDGTNDAVQAPRAPSGCYESKYGEDWEICTYEFGCWGVPYTFSVVKPEGWPGTFSQISGVTFNNADASYTIEEGNLFYYPPSSTPTSTGTPTPRSTATPTPTRVPSTTVTPTPSGPLSCSFTGLPPSINVAIDTPYTVIPGIAQSGGTVDEVTFSINNSSVASVCASGICSSGSGSYTDTPGFSASIAGLLANQSTTLTLTGRMVTEGVACTPSSPITVNVLNTTAWCQFRQADVLTNGNITCRVPSTCAASGSCDNELIVNTGLQLPGVAIADGTINTGSANISEKEWKANTRYSGQLYTYDYFARKAEQLPVAQMTDSNITSLSQLLVGSSGGYYWVRYTGGTPLSINTNLDLGTNKIVLFVPNTDLLLNGKVNVTDGQGLFMAIVEGNIVVNETVGGTMEATPAPDLEGIYFTDKEFRTGSVGSDNDLQLHVRGSIASFDKILMERSLMNNSSTPAELFEYGPDQLMLFPRALGEQNMNWKEVAP